MNPFEGRRAPQYTIALNLSIDVGSNYSSGARASANGPFRPNRPISRLHVRVYVAADIAAGPLHNLLGGLKALAGGLQGSGFTRENASVAWRDGRLAMISLIAGLPRRKATRALHFVRGFVEKHRLPLILVLGTRWYEFFPGEDDPGPKGAGPAAPGSGDAGAVAQLPRLRYVGVAVAVPLPYCEDSQVGTGAPHTAMVITTIRAIVAAYSPGHILQVDDVEGRWGEESERCFRTEFAVGTHRGDSVPALAKVLGILCQQRAIFFTVGTRAHLRRIPHKKVRQRGATEPSTTSTRA